MEVIVWDREVGGVEGVTGEEEGLLEGGGPAGVDEGEVMVLGGAVDFVAYDRVAGVGKMDADLVHAPGLGECAEEGEGGFIAGEAASYLEAGAGGSAGGVYALLEINAGGVVDALAEDGGVNGEFIGGGPAPDDGGILLGDAAALHEHGKVAGGGAVFCNEDEAAGLAVETIDDGDLAAVDELESEEVAEEVPHGGFVGGLAGMDLEEGRLVDDDPIRRFGDDIEARGGGSGLRGSGGPGHSAE